MLRIISISLYVVINCTVVKAAIELANIPHNPGFNIIYDPANGKLGWIANSESLTRLEITSAGNLFLGDATEFTSPDGSPLYGEKGIYNSGTIIVENENGFPPGSLFGTQIFARTQRGLSGGALLADLSVSGMVFPDRQLCDATGGAFLNVGGPLPEPTSQVLIGFSVLSMVCFCRRRSTWMC